MTIVMDRKPKGKLKKRNYPLITIVLSSAIMALWGLMVVVAVLAIQPL